MDCERHEMVRYWLEKRDEEQQEDHEAHQLFERSEEAVIGSKGEEEDSIIESFVIWLDAPLSGYHAGSYKVSGAAKWASTEEDLDCTVFAEILSEAALNGSNRASCASSSVSTSVTECIRANCNKGIYNLLDLEQEVTHAKTTFLDSSKLCSKLPFFGLGWSHKETFNLFPYVRTTCAANHLGGQHSEEQLHFLVRLIWGSFLDSPVMEFEEALMP
ncbi:uncharacterized protein G2W53_009600 [Senna tora]|uniref:Uncharacterized protein n=1 Tax=Senna tora TaxID=362788 RepID=A0A834WYD1_9FABA|nr:uncharacterized protein G2W53_009600 [Senna tora]